MSVIEKVHRRSRARSTAIVIVGHGSRVAGANEEFEAFVSAFAAAIPDGVHVSHGYIEQARPALDTALARAAKRSRIVIAAPLILFAAGHVKRDIPRSLAKMRSRFPDVIFRAAKPLGVHRLIVDAGIERIGEVAGKRPRPTLVMISRGSNDRSANDEFFRLTRLVAARVKPRALYACFSGLATPRLEEALSHCDDSRARHVIVAPHFLFDGVLVERIRRTVSEFAREHPRCTIEVAPVIGGHRNILELLRLRLAVVTG